MTDGKKNKQVEENGGISQRIFGENKINYET